MNKQGILKVSALQQTLNNSSHQIQVLEMKGRDIDKVCYLQPWYCRLLNIKYIALFIKPLKVA
jgi:hypothetical protein